MRAERDDGCGHPAHPDAARCRVDLRDPRWNLRRRFALNICCDAHRAGMPGEAKAEERDVPDAGAAIVK